MKSVGERIFISSFIFISIAFIAGVTSLFALLVGGIYYIGLILSLAIFLFLLFVLTIFEFFKQKREKKFFSLSHFWVLD